MEKRKDYVTTFGELKINHVCNHLKVEFGRQVPTGAILIGRIRYLIKNGQTMKLAQAINAVEHELSGIWIVHLNIYPHTRQTIVSKLKSLYSDFRNLLDYSDKKKNENYEKRVKDMCEMLQQGFDIKTSNVNRIKTLEKENSVKMTADEYKLHEDNCKTKSCSCAWNSIIKCQQCPRQMFKSDTVARNWQNWTARNLRDRQAIETQKENQREQMKAVDVEDEDENEKDSSSDNYSPPENYQHEYAKVRTVLRSVSEIKSSEYTTNFPKVPLKYSKKNMNPKVMRAIVHCQASYKVSDNDLEGIIVDIANMIFDQSWVKCDQGTFHVEDPNSDSEDDIDSNKRKIDHCEENVAVEKKRRRVKENINCSFPSRRTRRDYLRQGAILNLRDVGRKIALKSQGTVITWGFDDTTKAAGNKMFDIKASNITFDGDGMERQTLTTGFTPNISHSGKDQATTLKYSLQTLAILTRGEIDDHEFNVDDLIELIDFFMSDRSADGNVVLDELDIEESKRLKCSAHVILSIDEALDSVFKNVESCIGRDKLIGSNVGGAFQSSSSIITLGLIALAKALSPSHAALSYSLYMQYKSWRDEHGLERKDSFKGFQSNRIGRIAFLASLYLEHKNDLLKFFEETVDENSNRLVLALSDYMSSDWFSTGCEVYKSIENLIIKPLCDILGIDDFGKAKRDDRNWLGVKDFFEKKIKN